LLNLYWITARRDWFATPTSNRGSQEGSRILAIGSTMDEAWQILHHLRGIDNPLAVKSGLFVYLGRSALDHISRRAQIARIHGAKSYKDIGFARGCFLTFIHLVSAFLLLAIIANCLSMLADHRIEGDFLIVTFVLAIVFLVVPLIFAAFLGAKFYSAFLSPFRWCVYGFGTIMNIFTDTVTYFVRTLGWKVVLTMTLGL
jgi:hypothetical protein